MRRFLRIRPLLSFAIVFSAAALLAQQTPTTNVSLVSDHASVAPGSSAWIAICFQLQPGWHIYWMNPGDAGQAPSVQWTLPAGWTASSLEWPAPQRLQNSAGVDYGYPDEATLLTRVKVPASARSGNTANLVANLKWLVCKDVCVPQKQTANLNLRVGPSVVDIAGKQLVDVTRARIPKALPDDWKANVYGNARQIVLNFMPGKKVDQAIFFPEDQQVIQNAAEQELHSNSTHAQLAMVRDPNAHPEKLKGVLVIGGTDAYNVNLPVRTH